MWKIPSREIENNKFPPSGGEGPDTVKLVNLLKL